MRWRSVWDSNPRSWYYPDSTVFRTAPFIHSGNAPDMDTVRRRENTVSKCIYHRKSRVVAATLFSLSVDTMVYHAGFEPAAFCSQSRRATKLR